MGLNLGRTTLNFLFCENSFLAWMWKGRENPSWMGSQEGLQFERVNHSAKREKRDLRRSFEGGITLRLIGIKESKIYAFFWSKDIQVRGAALFVYMELYDFTLYDVWLGVYFYVNFPLVEFLEIFQKPPDGFEGLPGDAWEWHPFLGFEMNWLAARVTPLGDANPCVLVKRFCMDFVMVGYWARFLCMIWMYKLMKSMIITMFVWI